MLLLLTRVNLIANVLLLGLSVDVMLRWKFNVMHLHWLLDVLRGRMNVHVLNLLLTRMVLTIIGVIWMSHVVGVRMVLSVVGVIWMRHLKKGIFG